MVKCKEPSKSDVKDASILIKQNEEIQVPNEITTEKKHTNAFQLLMDSRNKSIGSNSLGKERGDDQSDNEAVIEKKNMKVKRKVLLEKMAEAKGYQKNKEIEEYHDNIIKKKMEKRAERLKTMILKEAKPSKANAKITVEKVAESSKLNLKNEAENTYCNKDKKNLKTFTIVDIFNTMTDPVSVSPEKKLVPKEDKEFLQKLSPSLRKRESMLSYFKKVDKEPEFSPVDSDNDNLIKVKLQLKSKKKGKKKKLSLKKEPFAIEDSVKLNDENKDIASNSKALTELLPKVVENSESINFSERQKRKRNEKKNISEEKGFRNESRPKRAIKKPVKYTDDACISSSDDELLIFTPKKKKYLDNSTNLKVSDNYETQNVLHEHNKKPIVDKKDNEERNMAKKTVKLAPIFAPKQLDTAALEAKQKFLQSGVPDKLKKIIQQQKIQSSISNDFPVVVHVQQRHSDVDKWEQLQLNVYEESADANHVLILSNIDKDAYKKLLNLEDVSRASCIDTNSKKSIQMILQNIKQIHPKFPVYRTYRYLRAKRNGDLKDCNLDFNNSIEIMNDEVDIISNSPDKLNWTDKYKAISTNQIIGNFESIKELRKWLVSWSENEIKLNSRGNSNSDSSDYYQSDTDSRDSLKTTNNLLILTGPTGCGKTSSVYTVAAELAIKVIEVNASSKRTGKIMLQDLQEATQSHKVNRGSSNTESSQKSQEKNLTELLKKNKKKGRPKKSTEKSKKSTEESITLSATPSSQESVRTAMSLILVDDADIVFDQDDGFTSAVVQLVQSSKRPVILITSSLVCPHLQRFFLNGKILKMSPLLPRLVGTWLDIMCLADTGNTWPGLGANFLNYFNGDIRKTINYLQFYVSSSAYRSISNEETASQDVDYPKSNIDDENSNMSWADNLDSEERKLIPNTYNSNDVGPNSLWTDFVDGHLNLSVLRYPIQLFDIWWSVPHLLNTVPSSKGTAMLDNKSERLVGHELDAIANVMDAISLSDYVTHTHPALKSDITWPWHTCESDSVSEQDNIDYYRNFYEVADEISHTLVSGYIVKAQDILSCDRKTEIQIPGMSFQSSAYRSISNEETASQDVDYPKSNIDDENSNMSWADNLDSEERKLIPNTYNSNDVGPNSLWTDFVDGHLNLSVLRYPIQLFDIWWSVPHLLNTVPSSKGTAMLDNKSERLVGHELDAIANVMDAISLSDYVTHTHPALKSDITWPWHTCESDSVSEQDNIDYYRNFYEVADEISHTLVSGYIVKAQDILSCDRKTEIQIPGMSFQRERDKIVTRHKNLTSYLSTWSTLDRRSLALDYWSSCRTICRIEKSKTDTQINVKRNNRFCHYLKSLSVLCKSDTFDNLCDSLSSQGTELNISKFNE